MSADSSGLTDEVVAELNPGPQSPPADQSPSIPNRPADSAKHAVWVDYVVALGADRGVATDTRHFDAQAGDYVTVPGLTRDELIKLADRLGG